MRVDKPTYTGRRESPPLPPVGGSKHLHCRRTPASLCQRAAWSLFRPKMSNEIGVSDFLDRLLLPFNPIFSNSCDPRHAATKPMVGADFFEAPIR